MNIPINPEHSRKRRQKYGPDGSFLTAPAPRPEPAYTESLTESYPPLSSLHQKETLAAASDFARELVQP